MGARCKYHHETAPIAPPVENEEQPVHFENIEAEEDLGILEKRLQAGGVPNAAKIAQILHVNEMDDSALSFCTMRDLKDIDVPENAAALILLMFTEDCPPSRGLFPGTPPTAPSFASAAATSARAARRAQTPQLDDGFELSFGSFGQELPLAASPVKPPTPPLSQRPASVPASAPAPAPLTPSEERSRPSEEPLKPSEAPSKSSEDFPNLNICCPISRDLFKDPVVAADGIIYERSFIKKYVSEKIDAIAAAQRELDETGDSQRAQRIIDAGIFSPMGLGKFKDEDWARVTPALAMKRRADRWRSSNYYID